MTAVETIPVPACPPGATEAPLGVAPGRLAAWRVAAGGGWVTITLGYRDGSGPWVELHTAGAKATPEHDDLAALGHLTTALATAHGWLARWQPETAGQASLFEDGAG